MLFWLWSDYFKGIPIFWDSASTGTSKEAPNRKRLADWCYLTVAKL